MVNCRVDASHGETLRPPFVTFTHPSPILAYSALTSNGCMNRKMPRPEEVSWHHIDATLLGFLSGERDIDWTEVSLVTLHPREEIRLVLNANQERYRTINSGRLRELLSRLRSQGVFYK